MKIATYNISLDIRRRACQTELDCVCGDTARRICARFTEDGVPYAIEEGTTALFAASKPDGTAILSDCTVEDGCAIYDFSDQTAAVPGRVECEIRLIDEDGRVITAPRFSLMVGAHVCDDGDLAESSSEFSALTDIILESRSVTAAAKEATAEAAAAAQNADTMAGMAMERAGAANAAALAANTAAEEASKVNIKAEQTATGATVTVTDRDGTETAVHIDTLTAVESWEDVKNAVRLGVGSRLFPVGYEFTTEDSATGAVLTWAVRAHNRHTAANKRLADTMTLELKHVYGSESGTYKSLAFDAPEALYYAKEKLPAGTYNFTWDYATGSMVKDTYQFTLTHSVPAGGQIVLGTNLSAAAITSCKISTYGSVAATAAIESGIAVTSGSAGTSLGTVTSTTATSEYLNCAQRIMWGSNNYAQSAVRQWLNSDAAAGGVWSATNVFDRSPAWAAGYGGFMLGLPADFLAVVQTASVPCRTNSVFETDSLDGTVFDTDQIYSLSDRFFLLSRPEVYGDWDDESCKDGELLDYYEGLTDTERIKRDEAGTARYCWLRSPLSGHAGFERYVNASGKLNHNYATYAGGVTPACIIA